MSNFQLSKTSRVECWFSNVLANISIAIFRVNVLGGGGGVRKHCVNQAVGDFFSVAWRCDQLYNFISTILLSSS
jgi:hypothetical protein